MKLNIRQITHAGLLIAISVILMRLGAVMVGNTIRLSFGNVPIYMAGMLFGPVVGGVVGALSDLLGYFINSYGAAFTPHIFLASVMRGIIPGLTIYLVSSGKNWYVKVLLSIIATEIVSGILLTTWGLVWLYNTPFMVMLPGRLVALLVQVPIYTVITYMLTVKLRTFVSSYSVSK
jgi:ECF transporter S component (folate family)